MPNFFIYSSSYFKENSQGEKNPCSVTIIFCDRESIEIANLQSEIKHFYETNYQTDEIFVIGGIYNKSLLKKIFIDNQLDTFKYIPKLQREHLADGLFLFTFNKDGKLNCENKPEVIDKEVIQLLISEGLVTIFKKRGGLIEAKGDAHHFVFPSGKHCNKFLRTGNILLHSSEIYFIAFNLLSRYEEEDHKQIFCDTSSINTLAFALLELKRKLIGANFKMIPIESFSSYDGLFSKSVRFFGNSLILISSSTSGNILEKIIKHDDSVDINNAVILFYLGSKTDYRKNKTHIVCNLTKSDESPNGIQYYNTFTERDCVYCKKGSYPVQIKGDVFLLESPKINRITINVTDAPKRLSNFVNQFKSKELTRNNIFKVNYKENLELNNKYEIYFDMYKVLSAIEERSNSLYKEYEEKLFSYINQYIPSNTKFFITLPDEGSQKLAEIILNFIKPNYLEDRLPKVVKFDEVVEKISNEQIEGAAVIIGSCISNGKNLLYLSRTFRPFNKLRLIYFIGLTRTNNESYLNFLKSNLKQGNYGRETNSFIEVESFYCNKDSKNTTWLKEKDFITELVEFLDDEEFKIAKSYFQDRIRVIDESLSNQVKGLSNSLFYPDPNNRELRLRKGFAFFNFQHYKDHVSQADIYFTISSVINNLRNSEDYEHCLKQSEFVRNIIDPGNFNRFNDGIIQACILRSSKAGELTYHIDEDLSADMKAILEKIIDEHYTPQGEGLLEFLYAIAIEKLTLKTEHIIELSKKIDKIQDNEIALAFNLYIKNYIIESKKFSLQEQLSQLREENKELKDALGR